MIRTNLIGLKGDPGPAGASGAAGAAGPAGAQGKSAYQSAAESGFLGTENEWVKLSSDGAYPSNKLINNYPTVRGRPYLSDDTAGYTAINTAGGTIEPDSLRIDPITSCNMAKITIPAGNTSYQSIDFYNLPVWQMDLDDVWMLLAYVPSVNSALSVQILVSNDASIGTNYRNFIWSGNNGMSRGYNLLSALHKETSIGVTAYGTVGTTIRSAAWTNNGTETDSSQSRSVRVRVKLNSAQGADTVIYFGSLLTAPAGWAKGAVVWMADDVPTAWDDLAIPVLESYGWVSTMAAVSAYSSDGGNYIQKNRLQELRLLGHEILGHTRRHNNMVTSATDEKTRAIKAAAEYWNSVGIPTAAKYMAWPFGAFDDAAITILKDNGYKLALSIVGDAMNPLIAGTNPYYLNRLSIELSNPWQVDSAINGAILRGQGVVTYGHTPVVGGSGSPNNYPGSTSFYIDHLKRWCDIVAAHESAGRCVVTTFSQYFKMCGINPETHNFVE